MTRFVTPIFKFHASMEKVRYTVLQPYCFIHSWRSSFLLVYWLTVNCLIAFFITESCVFYPFSIKWFSYGLQITKRLFEIFLKIIWILSIDFNWLDQSPTRKVFNCYLIKVKECHILKDSFVLEHYLTRTVNLFHFDISTLQA